MQLDISNEPEGISPEKVFFPINTQLFVGRLALSKNVRNYSSLIMLNLRIGLCPLIISYMPSLVMLGLN